MPASKSTVNVNMPADKKTAKKPVETAPAVEVSAPKTKKSAKTEVTVPVVSSAPAVEAPAAALETRTAPEILAGLQETLKALSSELTTRVRAAVHDAQEAVKAIKRDARDSKKRRKVDPADMTPEQRTAWEARRANNAFLKMRPLTDELCTFMALPAKSQRSQTDVTKFVSQYVKAHNCFDPNFKRRIIPDAKLGKLLRVKDGQEVTYLNLQSFLKVHFLKPAVTA
uniref:DM2 domain-containing protein n=1 Tax=viral metagenome TaxID=1070528 RepID=A0A6C0JME2_9ZZZZ